MKKVILAALVILFIWKCGCSDSQTNQSSSISNSLTTNKFLAYNYAEDFISQRLKSPSSAKFPEVSEKINHIKSLGKDKYEINSWVDSQNGFGAMIRSRFSCRIIFENGSVRAENIIIE